MDREIRLIEEQLNKLCSQHDELMSLLGIVDYLSSIKHLQGLNISLGSRISQADKQISDAIPKMQDYNLHEKSLLILKNQQFASSLSRFGLQLQALLTEAEQIKANLQSLQKKKPFSDSGIQERIQSQLIHSRLLAAEKHMATEIAAHKRRLASKEPTKRQQIDIRAITDMLLSYEKLETKIAALRVSMEVPPIQQFCRFTCNRVRRGLYKIKERSEALKSKVGSEEWEQSRGQLRRLKYQVKGLKQMCGEELLILYSQVSIQGTQAKEANYLQAKIRDSIEEVERHLDELDFLEA